MAFVATPAGAEMVSGLGKAMDGDSLHVGQTEVRLYGIDAPELHQQCQRGGQSWQCGADAKYELSKLVDGKAVQCAVTGGDTYGRTLARCRVGDVDINRAMVALGFALAYRRYSLDYINAEETAKASRRGMWAGTFELPSKIRHPDEDYVAPAMPAAKAVSDARRKLEPSHSSQALPACLIKGNHSRKGERIYHLPGMPYYEQTKPEQMFCTERQAQAAGYRRSRADQHR